MTSLFLEPFSGISGDMLNGLLVDLGADVELLHTELEKLGVDGFHLHVHRVAKSAIWWDPVFGGFGDPMLPRKASA